MKWWSLNMGAVSSVMSYARAQFPENLHPRQVMDIKWNKLTDRDEEFIVSFFKTADEKLLKEHFQTESQIGFSWDLKLDFLDPESAELIAKCNPDMEFEAHMSPTIPMSLPASVFRAARIQTGATKMVFIYSMIASCDEMLDFLDREAHVAFIRYGGFAFIDEHHEVIGMAAMLPYYQASSKEDTSVGIWFGDPVWIENEEFESWRDNKNGNDRLRATIFDEYRRKLAINFAYVVPDELVPSRYGGMLYEFEEKTAEECAKFTEPPLLRVICNRGAGGSVLFYPILGENTGIFPDGLGPYTLVTSQLHAQEGVLFGLGSPPEEKYWEASRRNTKALLDFQRSEVDVRAQAMIEVQWGPEGRDFAFPMLITKDALTMVDGTLATSEYGMFDGDSSRHLMTVFLYPAVDRDTGNGNLVPGNGQIMYQHAEDTWKQYVAMSDGGILFVGVKPDHTLRSEQPIQQTCLGKNVQGSCQFHFMTLIEDFKGRFKFDRAIRWRSLSRIKEIPDERFFPVTNPRFRQAGARSYCWITEADNVDRIRRGIAFKFVDEKHNVAFALKGGFFVRRLLMMLLSSGIFIISICLLMLFMGAFVHAMAEKSKGRVPHWMQRFCPTLAKRWKMFFRRDFAGQDDDDNLESRPGIASE